MRYLLNCLFLVIKSKKRLLKATEVDNIVVMALGILGISLILLLVFLSSLFHFQINLLMNLVIFYLLVGYNLPLILQEFRTDNFKNYRIVSRTSLRLLVYLILENNPVIICAPLYLAVYSVFNIFNVFNVIAVCYAASVSLLYLLLYIIKKYELRVLFGFLFLTEIIILFHFETLLGSALILIVNLCFLLFLYRQLGSAGFETPFNQEQSRFRTGQTTLYILPVKRLIVRLYKELFYLLGILLVAIIFKQLKVVRLPELLYFMSLFDLELSLDKKYKHLAQYKAKYYFIKLSKLNIIKRFLISDSYWVMVKTGLYICVAEAANSAPFILIFIDLTVNFVLGLVYYTAEERMFENGKKTNGILFQYVVLSALFLVIILTKFFEVV